MPIDQCREGRCSGEGEYELGARRYDESGFECCGGAWVLKFYCTGEGRLSVGVDGGVRCGWLEADVIWRE